MVLLYDRNKYISNKEINIQNKKNRTKSKKSENKKILI